MHIADSTSRVETIIWTFSFYWMMFAPFMIYTINKSRKKKIPFVFKASYKKANRTKLESFTGIGDETALRILADIRN